MKKILLIFILLSSICGITQARLLEEGMTWEYREFAPLVKDRFFTYTVIGDSVVNDTAVVKVRYTEGGAPIYDYCVHEEDGKIWVYIDWNGPARYQLVIDFNLHPGVSDDYYVEVLEETAMEIEGVSRRVLSVAYPNTTGPHSYWIDGVGITTSDIYLSSIPFPTGHSEELLSCYLNGECLFSKANFDLQTGIESAIIDAGEDAPIYNLQGMRVSAPKKGCVYIRDGKKLVW